MLINIKMKKISTKNILSKPNGVTFFTLISNA